MTKGVNNKRIRVIIIEDIYSSGLPETRITPAAR